MSDDVESIDWTSLGYPQAPELIEALTSGDERTQVEAANRLEAEIILGGLNWQDFDLGKGISTALRSDAPVYLAPILLGLLRPDISSIKSDILDLLFRMLHYHHMIDKGEIFKSRAASVRTAIWDGRSLILDLLSSSDVVVRKGALDILLEFREPKRNVEAYDLIARRFAPPLPPPENDSSDA